MTEDEFLEILEFFYLLIDAQENALLHIKKLFYTFAWLEMTRYC